MTLPSAVVDEHYPVEWESDVVLTDGGTIHLRPIPADDDAGLVGLFARDGELVIDWDDEIISGSSVTKHEEVT